MRYFSKNNRWTGLFEYSVGGICVKVMATTTNQKKIDFDDRWGN